jgi:FkbM family methyltransferase
MTANFYHWRWVNGLRTVARKFGILRLLQDQMIKRGSGDYEADFNKALRSSIKEGDTVWDVGAHVGIYTGQFLEWAGSSGRVVAFEPLPRAFEELERSFGGRENVTLIPAALSSAPGRSNFCGDTTDAITMNAHLAADSELSEGAIAVDVVTADEMVAKGISGPNAVKVDVEGFEEEVLMGGQKAFSDAACHDILVEVHFNRIYERGIGESASRIVRMLKKWGYNVEWVDSSHLHASRP